MTNKEIFRKALEKARKNGLEFKVIVKDMEFSFNDPIIFEEEGTFKPICSLEEDEYVKFKRLIRVQVDSTTSTLIGLESLIFSHDFAKAFWIECKNPDFGPLCITHDCDIRDCTTWEDHLQQMVLEKEPLKYLEKFL